MKSAPMTCKNNTSVAFFSPELPEVIVIGSSLPLTVLPESQSPRVEPWVSRAKAIGLRKKCQGLRAPNSHMLGYCAPSVEETGSQHQGIGPESCIMTHLESLLNSAKPLLHSTTCTHYTKFCI
jgi:hypothetical protein